MGGALAQPCKSLPRFFPSDTLFAKYPFLLPNLVCTGILALGLLVGVLFLEETHREKKYEKDTGLEVGRWILHLCIRIKTRIICQHVVTEQIQPERVPAAYLPPEDEELPEYSFSDGPVLPGYRTTDGTPRQSSSRSQSPSARFTGGLAFQTSSCRAVHKAFNKQVLLAIGAFGILA